MDDDIFNVSLIALYSKFFLGRIKPREGLVPD